MQKRLLIPSLGLLITLGAVGAPDTARATVMLTGIPISTPEAQSFVGSVATFTDTNASDTSSSFTATINWGDGSLSTGTITGGQGNFTIAATHTYNDELLGTLGISLFASNNPSTPIASASPAATVTEADVFSGTPAGTILGAVGQSLTDVLVANFKDSIAFADLSDFSAAIDWGDGRTTAGTLINTGNGINVEGTHTYAASATYAVTTTITDDAPGTASDTVRTSAMIAPVPEPSTIGLLAVGIVGIFSYRRRGQRT
jgi:hypothetical protein